MSIKLMMREIHYNQVKKGKGKPELKPFIIESIPQ